MKNEAQIIEVPDADVCEDPTDSEWLVQTPGGVRSWSLDELDAAFQRGEVDADTLVYTSGMAAWTTLGVIASLDEPIANDTGATAERSARPASAHPARQRSLPPPPVHFATAAVDSASRPSAHTAELAPSLRARSRAPSGLQDPGSFAATSADVFGDGGAPMWASIGGATRADIATGLRHHTPVVPFALRRAVGGALDVLSTLRVTHPRWAAAGPWLFGAALSGIFIFSLYRLANAPSGPVVPARSASAPRATTDGTAPSRAGESDPSAARTGLGSPELARPLREITPPVPASRDLAAQSDHLAADDRAAEAGRAEDGVVLRTRELRLAPNRPERQLTRSSRARAKAAARKAKMRAARMRSRSSG